MHISKAAKDTAENYAYDGCINNRKGVNVNSRLFQMILNLP